MSLRKASVIVAGSWGTALASVLADNGFQVSLWTRNADQAKEISSERKNRKYSGDLPLHEQIAATVSMEEALAGAEIALFAAPSSAMRSVAKAANPFLEPSALVIHATKGFEPVTQKRMTEVMAEELTRIDPSRLTVLSGPSHAEEVIRKLPATVVVASEREEAAKAAQDALMNRYFRVYTNADVTGVEVAGALKNIIALGAGMSDGLGYGDNAKAALITRGLAEITRLGAAMGGNVLTFAGLSGVGDLVVTCTSKHSRNWRAGFMLGQGKPVEEVLSSMNMVVEGIKTTETAFSLAQKHGVTMPITEQLHQVLFAGKPPHIAVEELMGRMKTNEIDELTDGKQAGQF
jgi:glycerol-3-phosphate dehydrogenase (NAD(P)+)